MSLGYRFVVLDVVLTCPHLSTGHRFKVIRMFDREKIKKNSLRVDILSMWLSSPADCSACPPIHWAGDVALLVLIVCVNRRSAPIRSALILVSGRLAADVSIDSARLAGKHPIVLATVGSDGPKAEDHGIRRGTGTLSLGPPTSRALLTRARRD